MKKTINDELHFPPIPENSKVVNMKNSSQQKKSTFASSESNFSVPKIENSKTSERKLTMSQHRKFSSKALDVGQHISDWYGKEIEPYISQRKEVPIDSINILVQELVFLFIATFQEDSTPAWDTLLSTLKYTVALSEKLKDYPQIQHYIRRTQYHVSIAQGRLLGLNILETLHDIFPQLVPASTKDERSQERLKKVREEIPVSIQDVGDTDPFTESCYKSIEHFKELKHTPAQEANLTTAQSASKLPCEDSTLKEKSQIHSIAKDSKESLVTQSAIEGRCKKQYVAQDFKDLSFAHLAKEEKDQTQSVTQDLKDSSFAQSAKEMKGKTQSFAHTVTKGNKKAQSDEQKLKETSLEHSATGKKCNSYCAEQVSILPKTGQEVVVYFNSQTETESKIQFFYLVPSPKKQYNPYDLAVVPKSKITKDHYIFSKSAILHVQSDGSSESISLEDWSQEAKLFERLSVLPSFKNFLLRKAFFRWKENTLLLQYNSTRQLLSERLLPFDPAFKGTWIRIMRIISRISTIELFPWEPTVQYLKEFRNGLTDQALAAKPILDMCLTEVDLELVNIRRQTLSNFNIWKKTVRLRTKAHSKLPIVQSKQEQAYRKQQFQKALNTTQNLGCFHTFVIELFTSHLLHLVYYNLQRFLVALKDSTLAFKMPLVIQETKVDLVDDDKDLLQNLPVYLCDISTVVTTAAAEKSGKKNERLRFALESAEERYTLLTVPELVVTWHPSSKLIIEGEGMPASILEIPDISLKINTALNESLDIISFEKELVELLCHAYDEIKTFLNVDTPNEILNFCSTYGKREDVEKLLDTPPEKLEATVKEIQEWQTKLLNLPDTFYSSNKVVQIDCSCAKSVLSQKLMQLIHLIVVIATNLSSQIGRNLCKKLTDSLKILEYKPTAIGTFAAFVGTVQKCTDKQEVWQKEVININTLFKVIRLLRSPLTKEEVFLQKEVNTTWKRFEEAVEDVQEFSGIVRGRVLPDIDKTCNSLFQDLEVIYSDVNKGHFISPKTAGKEVLRDFSKFKEHFQSVAKELRELTKWRETISGQTTSLEDLDSLECCFNARGEVWKHFTYTPLVIKEWMEVSVTKDLVCVIKERTKEWHQQADVLEQQLPSADPVLAEWQKLIDRMKKLQPILEKLVSPIITCTFWDIILNGLGCHKTEINIPPTLKPLMDHDIENHGAWVEQIYRVAQRSLGVENILHNISETWIDLQFHLTWHTEQEVEKQTCRKLALDLNELSDDNTILMLENGEFLKEVMEHHQVQLQALESMCLENDISNKIHECLDVLSQVWNIVDVWQTCQQQWLLLNKYSCTISGNNGTPQDVFSHLTAKFKDILERMVKDPYIFSYVPLPSWIMLQESNKEKAQNVHLSHRLLVTEVSLEDKLKSLKHQQEELMASLNTCLVEERCIFPRLYFISDEELLDYMAFATTDCLLLYSTPLVPRCFPAIYNLNFGICEGLEEEGNVIQVIGSCGETLILLEQPIFSSSLGNWLLQLESSVSKILHSQLVSCFKTTKAITRSQLLSHHNWLLGFPAQLICVILSSLWNQAIEEQLKASMLQGIIKLREETQEEQDILVDQLKNLRLDQSESMLYLVLTQAFMLLHRFIRLLDVLINKQITSAKAFEWQSYVKQMVETHEERNSGAYQADIRVRCMEYSYFYGYEYNGIDNGLIATDTSDKVHLFLLKCLHDNSPGAVIGPPLSGKSEIFVNLAKILGRACFTLSCQPTLSLATVVNHILGAVTAGCLLSMDQVNSLPESILSLLGEQITSLKRNLDLLALKKTDKSIVLCSDENLNLSPDSSVFVTKWIPSIALNERKSSEPHKVSSAIDQTIEKLLFFGQSVKVKSGFGLFMTVTEKADKQLKLPRNFMVSFRVCHVVEPFPAMILEGIFFSLGFTETISIASSLVELMQNVKSKLPASVSKYFTLKTLKKTAYLAAEFFNNPHYGQTDDENQEDWDGVSSTAELEERAIVLSLQKSFSSLLSQQEKIWFKDIIEQSFPYFLIGELDTEIFSDWLLKQEVELCLVEMGINPSEELLSKVLDIFSGIHSKGSVALVGPSGSGKTLSYRSLIMALNNLSGCMSDKETNSSYPCVCVRHLFPGGVTQTAKPKGENISESNAGFLSAALSHYSQSIKFNETCNQISTHRPQTWLIVDSIFYPYLWESGLRGRLGWEHILNSDGKMKHSTVKLLVETLNLNNASPAFLTSVSVVMFSNETLHWKSLVEGWARGMPIQCNLSLANMDTIVGWIEDSVPAALSFLENTGEKVWWPEAVFSTCQVSTFLQVLTCVLKTLFSECASTQDRLQHMTRMKTSYAYAFLWGFGGQLNSRARKKFEPFVQTCLKNCIPPIKPPDKGSTFDYTIHKEHGQWVLADGGGFASGKPMSTSSFYVPVSSDFGTLILLEWLMKTHQPILINGEIGSGKSALLKHINRTYQNSTMVSLSAGYHPAELCQILQMLQKRVRSNGDKASLAPLQVGDRRRLLVCVDDLHLGGGLSGLFSVQEVIRSLCSVKKLLVGGTTRHIDMNNLDVIVSCATSNPPLNLQVLSSRLRRHFVNLHLSTPNEDSFLQIYSSSLSDWLSQFPKSILQNHALLVETIVSSAFELHCNISTHQKLSEENPLCVFSWHSIRQLLNGLLLVKRDKVTLQGSIQLSSVVARSQGALKKRQDSKLPRLATKAEKAEPPITVCKQTFCWLLKVWIHEAQRVYMDRVWDWTEKEWIKQRIIHIVEKHIWSKMWQFVPSKSQHVMLFHHSFQSQTGGGEKHNSRPSRSHVGSTVVSWSMTTEDVVTSDKQDVPSYWALADNIDDFLLSASDQEKEVVNETTLSDLAVIAINTIQISRPLILENVTRELIFPDQFLHHLAHLMRALITPRSHVFLSSHVSWVGKTCCVETAAQILGYTVVKLNSSSDVSVEESQLWIYVSGSPSFDIVQNNSGASDVKNATEKNSRESSKELGSQEIAKKTAKQSLSKEAVTVKCKNQLSFKTVSKLGTLQGKVQNRRKSKEIKKSNVNLKQQTVEAQVKKHYGKLTNDNQPDLRVGENILTCKTFGKDIVNNEPEHADYSTLELKEWYLLKQIRLALLLAGLQGDKIVLIVPTSVVNYQGKWLNLLEGLLQHGDCQWVWNEQDMENIVVNIRRTFWNGDRVDHLTCYEMFIDRVKKNLHVIICHSGRKQDQLNLIERLRPVFTQISYVEHFLPWNKECLTKLALQYLRNISSLSLSDSLCESVATVLAELHLAALEIQQDCNHYQVIHPSWIQWMVHWYSLLYKEIVEAETAKIEKIQQGLMKIKELQQVAHDYRERIVKLERDLREEEEHCRQAQEELQQCSLEYAVVEDKCTKLEAELTSLDQKMQDESNKIQFKLQEASPTYWGAIEQLLALAPSRLDEIKSYRIPPPAVAHVVEALCLLFGRPQRWESGRHLLVSDNFTSKLEYFDVESISESTFNQLKNYISDPSFTPSVIAAASEPAASLCTWIHAVYTYLTVKQTLKPLYTNKAKVQREVNTLKEELTKERAACETLENELNTKKQNLQISEVAKSKVNEQIATEENNLALVCKVIQEMNWVIGQWEHAVSQGKHWIHTAHGDALLTASVLTYMGSVGNSKRSYLYTHCRSIIGCTEQSMMEDTQQYSMQQMLKYQLPSYYPSTNDNHTELIEEEECVVTRSDFIPHQLLLQNKVQGLPADPQTLEKFAILKKHILNKYFAYLLIHDPEDIAVKWIEMILEHDSSDQKTSDTKLTSDAPRVFEYKKNVEQESILVLYGEDPELEYKLKSADSTNIPLMVKDFDLCSGLPLWLLAKTKEFHSSSENLPVFLVSGLPLYELVKRSLLLEKMPLLDLSLTHEGLVESITQEILAFEKQRFLSMERALYRDDLYHRKNLETLKIQLWQELIGKGKNLVELESGRAIVSNSREAAENSTRLLDETSALFQKLDQDKAPFVEVSSYIAVMYKVLGEIPLTKGLPFSKIISVLLENGKQKFENESEVNDISRSQMLKDNFLQSFVSYLASFLPSSQLENYLYQVVIEIARREGILEESEINFFKNGVSEDTIISCGVRPDWISPQMWNRLCLLERTNDIFKGLQASLTSHSQLWLEYLESPFSLLLPVPSLENNRELTPFHHCIIRLALNPEESHAVKWQLIRYTLGPLMMQFENTPSQEELQQIVIAAYSNSTKSTPLMCFTDQQSVISFQEVTESHESTHPAYPIFTLATQLNMKHKVRVYVCDNTEAASKTLVSVLLHSIQWGEWLVILWPESGFMWTPKLVWTLRNILDDKAPVCHSDFRLWIVLDITNCPYLPSSYVCVDWQNSLQ
ncbi:dynein heavy chain domain-containing protein 1-like isoform X2 [Tachypleus tridentatus]|uniref:dynein heavy chain domain-containing protein 1-like isoform X2 n=1 Tax=Tachypleus tridentatus TaxID=6853 RepID=UPI003FD3813E